jgi:hypothetical protein
MPELKFGKHAATEDDRDLLFARYVVPANLPEPPPEFGHEQLFPPTGWGMLGNDQWGDCAWAGSAHETMLLTTEGGQASQFTADGVLSDYSAGTGFDPNAGPPGDNPTDQGSNVRQVLGYRRSTGIVDATGNRHKIGSYVRLDVGNLTHLFQALYLFQAVGIGFQVPDSTIPLFQEGKPWDVIPGDQLTGEGHYVCCVGKRANLEVVTWGALQQMTVAFFEKYCDEAWTYISTEDLQAGKSPEGFNLDELKKDLDALHH